MTDDQGRKVYTGVEANALILAIPDGHYSISVDVRDIPAAASKLWGAAPDLARSVVYWEAEVERLRAELEATTEQLQIRAATQVLLDLEVAHVRAELDWYVDGYGTREEIEARHREMEEDERRIREMSPDEVKAELREQGYTDAREAAGLAGFRTVEGHRTPMHPSTTALLKAVASGDKGSIWAASLNWKRDGCPDLDRKEDPDA